jgi:hypothetical protein
MEKFKVTESTISNVGETEMSTVQKYPKLSWREDQKQVGAAVC